jgi:capsid portal protein
MTDRTDVMKRLVLSPGDTPKPVEGEQYGRLDNAWVRAPYDPLMLHLFAEMDTELGPCATTVANTAFGHGYRLVPRHEREGGPEPDAATKAKIKTEIREIRMFLDLVNRRQSICDLAIAVTIDRTLGGNGYIEVTRNAFGQIASLHHIPAHQIRICPQDNESVEISPPMVVETDVDGEYAIVRKRRFADRFRRFVRSADVGNTMYPVQDMVRAVITQDRFLGIGGMIEAGSFGGSLVYYSEYGDPRPMDERGNRITPFTAPLAHEIIHLPMDIQRGPYGLPPHIGARLDMLGERKQKEINFNLLINNSVPSMLIFVDDGGILTNDSVDRLRSYWETNVTGGDSRSRVVILEATQGQSEMGESIGRPKIHVEPLTNHQSKDQVFGEYSDRARTAIRHSLQTPSILLGGSDNTDANRQVIKEKIGLFDGLVAQQHRRVICDMLNVRILPENGWGNVVVEFVSPNTADPSILATIARDLEKTGAMSPARATVLAEIITGKRLPPLSGVDVNRPFTLQVMESQRGLDDAARAAGSPSKQDQVDLADQTEPSQQVMGEA